MTGDLTAFTRARLDELEAAARASYYEGQRWLTEEEGVCRYPADEIVHYADRKADARHIALNDPAHVLRFVKAARAILAAHGPDPIGKFGSVESPRCLVCLTSREGYEEQWEADPCPCLTLRALASIWSTHPGYDPAWAPAETRASG